MFLMPAKRKPTDKSKSGKATLNLRLPNSMRSGLERLADLHGGDLTEEARNAIREYLERHQLWPPPIRGNQPPTH